MGCLSPPHGKRADGIQQANTHYLFPLSCSSSFSPSVRPVATDDRPYARHMTFLMLRHDLQIWSREEDEEETALCFLLAKFRQKEKLKNQKFESEEFVKVFNRQK
jgi:hypothetical protein